MGREWRTTCAAYLADKIDKKHPGQPSFRQKLRGVGPIGIWGGNLERQPQF